MIKLFLSSIDEAKAKAIKEFNISIGTMKGYKKAQE